MTVPAPTFGRCGTASPTCSSIMTTTPRTAGSPTSATLAASPSYPTVCRPAPGRPPPCGGGSGADPAPPELDGDVNLYPQASGVFGQLGVNNTFTGPRNVFRDVEVRRLHVTSDRSQKEDVRPLDPAAATELVRAVSPFLYRLDGEPAAGLMADDAPSEYVRRSAGDGTLSLDYHSLVAHLWASVQHAHRRIGQGRIVLVWGEGEKPYLPWSRYLGTRSEGTKPEGHT